MRAAGLPFFGPSRAAAEIEGSKAYAKRLMRDAGVPTAAFGVFEDVAAADAFIDAQPGAVVVKADGLAAGKGVVVTSTQGTRRRRPCARCWPSAPSATPARASSSRSA